MGLGNPGLSYSGNRHNVGFMAVNFLASSLKINFKPDGSVKSLVGRSGLGLQGLVLALPQTYMNLSGLAIAGLMKKFKITAANLLVVCDDLDLATGRLRIRPGGSSGGHRGLASIIEALGKKDFCRLRIGIGRPAGQEDPAEYVLKNFTRQEKIFFKSIIQSAAECCLCWAEKGLPQAMNAFNLKPKN